MSSEEFEFLINLMGPKIKINYKGFGNQFQSKKN
jgi:hypothetical protein